MMDANTPDPVVPASGDDAPLPVRPDYEGWLELLKNVSTPIVAGGAFVLISGVFMRPTAGATRSAQLSWAKANQGRLAQIERAADAACPRDEAAAQPSGAEPAP